MLCIWLVACSKKDADDSTPNKEQTCLLKETAITSANGSIGSKYSYDAAGKIVKLEFYEKGALSQYSTFTYNSKQLIEKESFYKADGTVKGIYTYSYDEADLLTQMVSTLNVGGTMSHTFTCTYEYAADKKLTKRTMQYPDGRLIAFYVYEYENEEMRRILTFNMNSQHTHTATLQYDDKYTALRNTPAIHKIGWQMIGNPHLHNIVSYTVISTSGQVLPESYLAAYEYNTTGQPTKLTKQYADGRELVSTLTYHCH